MSTESNRKLCSTHPSKARMILEKEDDAMAQETIHLAMMAAYGMYMVSCRLMGLQFCISAGLPLLWIRFTVECFHRAGGGDPGVASEDFEDVCQDQTFGVHPSPAGI